MVRDTWPAIHWADIPIPSLLCVRLQLIEGRLEGEPVCH